MLLTDLNFKKISEVSLYVHIPFCANRCRYCSFYFVNTKNEKIIDDCLNAILEQSKFMRTALSSNNSIKVKTVYFGGGTPSLITPNILSNFLKQFVVIWGLDLFPGEWAFECNPESLNQNLLDILREYGINRISLGIQSFSDKLLHFLGRRADSEIINKALALIEQTNALYNWPQILNIDLITGIPGQTKTQVINDLLHVFNSPAKHVSLYSLSIEEKSDLEKMLQLGYARTPRSEQQERLWTLADEVLEQRGFKNYEISNYAIPGAESKHNYEYWRMKPWLGLGPGAVSMLSAFNTHNTELPANSFWPVRILSAELFSYIHPQYHGQSCNTEWISSQDFLKDYLLTNLRTIEGLSLTQAKQVFGEYVLDLINDICELWNKKSYTFYRTIDTIILSRASRFLLDRILTDSFLLLDYQLKKQNKILACNWPLG